VRGLQVLFVAALGVNRPVVSHQNATLHLDPWNGLAQTSIISVK